MPGSPHRKRLTWLLPIAAAALLAIPIAATATHSLATLGTSTFEIDTDANFKVDHPGPTPPAMIDWASESERSAPDTLSGAGDESFGQGTKEDTAAPVIVDGSIPPNKSDLKYFGVHEEGSTGNGYLNMFWSRVQDPTGTTNMDFEFNRLTCTPNEAPEPLTPPTDTDCSANGLTPKRSNNDMLITYDLSNGGVNAQLSIRRWSDAQQRWGASNPFGTDAVGTINTTSIDAGDADGKGAHSPRTFGEAQIDLSAIFTQGCEAFGSVYLKSRSSDSFTSAVKDFVPPIDVNITNCATFSVQKYISVDENATYDASVDNTGTATDLTGWSFSVSKVGGGFSCTGTTDNLGVMQGCTGLDKLSAGTYTVTETGPTTKTLGNAHPDTGTKRSAFNSDPGPAPLALTSTVSKQVTLQNGGAAQVVRFGNSCRSMGRFSITVPAGTAPMFVRWSTQSDFSASTDVNLTGTTTRVASTTELRKGTTVYWKYGLQSDANNLVTGTSFALGGYPACLTTQTASFQNPNVVAFKYRDSDASGTRGSAATEPGLGGFAFELRDGSGNAFSPAVTTTSEADGDVVFTNVAPGSYRVYESATGQPAGWERTDPAAQAYRAVTVPFGASSVNAGLFGNTPLSKIEVQFTALADNPNGTDATASSITCTPNGGTAITETDGNVIANNLRVTRSQTTCVVTFQNNP